MIDLKELPKSLQGLQVYLIDIFCGFLIILSIYYSLGGNVCDNVGEKLIKVIYFISENILIFILFLLASWVIGYFVGIFISVIPRSKSKKIFDMTSKLEGDEFRLAMATIKEEKYKYRYMNLKSYQMSESNTRAFGSAFLISALFFLIASFIKLFILKFIIIDLLLSVIFISFFIAFEIEHRRIIRVMDNIIKWHLSNLLD